MEYYDEVVEIPIRPQPEATNMSTQNKKIIPESASIAGVGNINTELPAFQKLERAPVKKGTPLMDENNAASDTDESSDSDLNNRQQPFVIDHKEWDKLNVGQDVKEIFQYILRYSPSKVSIDYTLQPFIPDFIPAVGDIDAFLKVVPPKLVNEQRGLSEFLTKLGVDTLDEPSGQQSDPALLHMKLRSVSMQGRLRMESANRDRVGTGGSKLPLVPLAKSSKDVEKWIADIQNLHMNQMVTSAAPRRKNMPNIDALMNEWPPEVERTLNTTGFPNAYLDCSFGFYIRLVCSFLDISIPIAETQSDYIFALHTLFSLYMAVKNPTK